MRSAINPKIFPPLSLFPPRISKGRPASYPANVCHSKIAFNTAMTAARTQADTSVLSPKYEVSCCDQNEPPARRDEEHI